MYSCLCWIFWINLCCTHDDGLCSIVYIVKITLLYGSGTESIFLVVHLHFMLNVVEVFSVVVNEMKHVMA